jgi:KDO2-lipid IV(A) lauroyltransferase
MDGKYVQYVTAAVLCRLLPLSAAYALSEWVSGRLYKQDVRGREAVQKNLSVIYAFAGRKTDEDTLDCDARETFRHFGRYLVDFFRYTRLSRRQVDRLIDFQNRDRLDRAMDDGRGVILLSAHLGSWELGGGALATLGYPVNTVVLEQESQKTNALFQHYRRQRGLNVFPFGAAARESLRVLRRGESLA